MASAISNKSSPIHTSTILYRLWPHAVLTVCNSLRHHSISIITRWEKGAEEEGERRSRTHITHTLRAQVVLLQINLIIIKSLPATTANIPEEVCVHTHAPISLYISMHEGSAILLCKKKKKSLTDLSCYATKMSHLNVMHHKISWHHSFLSRYCLPWCTGSIHPQFFSQGRGERAWLNAVHSEFSSNHKGVCNRSELLKQWAILFWGIYNTL